MQIQLHPKAQVDLDEALCYYSKIDTNLEKKFITYLDKSFEKILKFPNLYQYETKTTQKVLMDIFPYMIIYEQYQDIVMILAIFHISRNPIKLDDRKFYF